MISIHIYSMIHFILSIFTLVYPESDTPITRSGILNKLNCTVNHLNISRRSWTTICAFNLIASVCVIGFVGYLLILHLYLYRIKMTTLQYSQFRRGKNQLTIHPEIKDYDGESPGPKNYSDG